MYHNSCRLCVVQSACLKNLTHHEPNICMQAQDDPIAPAAAIPVAALQRNPNCILAVTPHGGHLGWIEPHNIRGAPWTDVPMLEFLLVRLCNAAKLAAHCWQ
jgi:predicted alpha/beta-fold hydrolase